MTIPLGTDAVTAYRLTVQEDGSAPLSLMMGTWNVIDLPLRHGPDDLPDDMRREGDRVISDTPHEPLRLTLDEIVSEAFRLSGAHRAPDADGWHNSSNINRVANALNAPVAMAASGLKGGFMSYLRSHAMIETWMRMNVVYMRPRTGAPAAVLEAIRIEATCPGDSAPRALEEQATFGAAYRALLRMPRELIAQGTLVRMHRGDDERQVIFDAGSRIWVMSDGTPMPRRDPADPVEHTYRNGHLVHAVIGFVSRSRTGRIFANVGTPVDSPGDNDAFINRLDRKEADSVDEALELLRSRTDLDHIFAGLHDHGTMGYWLAAMKD